MPDPYSTGNDVMVLGGLRQAGHAASEVSAAQERPRRHWLVVLVVFFASSLLIAACSIVGGALLLPVFSDAQSASRHNLVIK